MRVKDKLKSLTVFAGYVLYIWNPENMNCRLIPLPKILPILRINSTNESFQLGKPSLYIEGKPLFVVIREIPYSIELILEKGKVLLDKNGKALKDKDGNDMLDTSLLVQKGYSASDIDAKLNSPYIQKIFKPQKFTFMSIFVMFLVMLSSVLITYIIVSTHYETLLMNYR